MFEPGGTHVTGPFSPAAMHEPEPVVAVLRFDVGTARFVIQDAASPTGGVQLTPRRLANYLSALARRRGRARRLSGVSQRSARVHHRR